MPLLGMPNKKKSKSLSRGKLSKGSATKTPLEQWPSKPQSANLPSGSVNTKIIVSKGQIIERVFKTPKGQIISLFTEPNLDKVA